MPTVKLNRKVVEKIIGKNLPIERLKDRISMLGTDLDSIDEQHIHVEIFPNRPDLLSEQGFARALSSFIGKNTGLRNYKVKKSGLKVIIDKNVTMRPYTACAIVKNIKFDDNRIKEIMQMQEKLATTHGRNRKKSAYGLYPLNKINFPVKYVAKDPKKVMFQPLGFDKEISADKVPELHKTGKMYKHMTEDWKMYPFFIDSKDNVMCMLPFTNSNDTGKIDESTTEVFIECTGTDLDNVKFALNMFCTTLSDMGGDIYSIEMVYDNMKFDSPNLEPWEMNVDVDYVNKILGLGLKEKEVKELLERMGYGWKNGKALIPSYRADIIHQVDLIEDIAIAYGYENVPEEIPNITTIARADPFEKFKDKVADILVGLQLLECTSYALVPKDMQTTKVNYNKKPIMVLDPVSSEYNSVRMNLLPGLLNILKENKHYGYPQKLFEVGRVCFYDDKNKIKEQDNLAIVDCHSEADFTTIKQVLDYLSKMIDVNFSIKELKDGMFVNGRCGLIYCDKKIVGVIGEINPEVIDNFELEMPVSALGINLEALYECLNK